MKRLAIALSCACLLLPRPAAAFNPPVDRAGPLTVRIEGPETVTESGKPLSVRVLLQNKGDAALEGTLRIGLIDRWQSEPAGAVPFRVEAGAAQTREFRVTAGEGTYSAHYPVHAFARFTHEGRELTAHPVLVLETKLPRRPRAPAPLEWKPQPAPDPGELALWQAPVFRAVYQVFGREAKTMPAGWRGGEERTGATLVVERPALDGKPLEAVGMHPPWREGLAGTIAAEFPLALPKTAPVKLAFALGQIQDGQSDGLTFRVRVAPFDAPDGQFGEVVFEKTVLAKSWQPAEADLSRFAGQTVRLQLESHPGPKNNTGWDHSFWGEPVLVCGGPPAPAPFPPASDDGSRLLGVAGSGGAEYQVRVWQGQRGLLDSVVGFVRGGERLCFRGFEVRVHGARVDDPRSPVLLKDVKEEPCDHGIQVRHRFESVAGPLDLVGRLSAEGALVRAKWRLENAPAPKPWQVVAIDDCACGPWSARAAAVYAGHGNVVRGPGPFQLGFDGHRLATSFVGLEFDARRAILQAVDLPPWHFSVEPGAKHYSLHASGDATFTFLPAENVWEAVRTWRGANGLKPGGGVREAAGRFVFDLWGGRYAQSAEALAKAFAYGLTDSMVMWHNWQRWGYDYRLPEIYPPNPQLGTLDEMRRLIAVCRKAGVPFAPHDNYIDFYPDAEGFSYEENVAFHADGRPVRAWLNEGRGAQSYRYRADRVQPYLRPNLELLKKELAPTAYFIDVWSSIGPYDYWTADGRFYTKQYTRDAWAREFAWIRELLGDNAPQISESGHDQLIGSLDGAQANHLRVGPPAGDGRYRWAVLDWKCDDSERVPWFDAAHHDRFILHGAGYPGRYEGGLDPRLHGIYSDDYLSTEVLTGHPAMVPAPFGRDVVRKYWLTAALMRALALRTIETVEFAGGDVHRQCVSWSGGGRVWVNRGESDWEVEGAVLPQYGFLARAPVEGGTVEASVARRGGVIVETARSPRELFVNGRQPVRGPRRIRLSVDGFRALAEGRFEMDLAWQADEPIPAGFRPFLHFCDGEGEIVFQAGHQGSDFSKDQIGRVAAKAVGQVPGGARPGTVYELRIGLYEPGSGERLYLSGPDDGTHRIRMGSVRVDGDGERVAGMSWTAVAPQPDPLLLRQNPEAKPVDFGPATTSGGVRLSRQGDALVITPLPEGDKPFTVAVRWSALPWKLPTPDALETLDAGGGVTTRHPLDRQGDSYPIVCEPGVFGYRMMAKGP